jgi:hypothetical protein
MDWVVIKDVALVVLEYAKVISWPVVVLIAFMVFGKTIKTTLGRISSFEANGYKAELAALEVKVEHIARDLKFRRWWWQFWRPQEPAPTQRQPPPDGAADADSPLGDRPTEGESTVPSAQNDIEDATLGQMMRNWAELEASTLALHQRLFAGSGGSERPYRRPRSVVTAVDDLRRNKLVSGSAYDAFAEAQQLRNAIVHGRPLTSTESSTFLRLIEKLKSTVRSWQDGML